MDDIYEFARTRLQAAAHMNAPVNKLRIAVFFGAVSLASSCVTARSAETTLAKAFISDDEEGKLGLQVAGELQKQGVKYVTNPLVTGYVTSVANRVLVAAKRERPGLNWHVQVIDDPKTVNAFATPGGYLYVYTGLLLAADNEAELAGVWGHEAGHVVARHSARQLVNQYGLETVLGMAVGKQPGVLAKLGSSVLEKGALLAHSREDEDEADEYGARYAAAAGYAPQGLVQFFRKLAATEGRSPRALQWISDHPATNNRIEHVNRYITANRLHGSNLGTGGNLAAVKATLLHPS